MSDQLPAVYLARHGETEWSQLGKHTGLTDIPLTPKGEQNASRLAGRLHRITFTTVLTSPLQRAKRTCELAGYLNVAQIEPDLVEWNYGQYEGRKTVDIHKERSDWQLFRDGCPGGESLAQIGARADRVIAQLRSLSGNTLLFSSGHILRVLAARWLGLPPSGGQNLLLSTASFSSVGYEHNLSEPAIRFWNDTSHLGG